MEVTEILEIFVCIRRTFLLRDVKIISLLLAGKKFNTWIIIIIILLFISLNFKLMIATLSIPSNHLLLIDNLSMVNFIQYLNSKFIISKL